MDKYTLFLDESSDKDKGYVLVSGFAIPNSQIELFEKSILEIKKLYWEEEYINSNSTVLHCTELSLIYNNRKNPELYKYIKRSEYNFFKKLDCTQIKEKYEKMYAKLCEIMRNYKSEFIKIVEKNIYNGNYLETDRDLRNFYGIRHIPEDYETVNTLKRELKKLRNAYKKVGREKENLVKKIEIMKKEKEELEEKIELLKEMACQKNSNEQLEQEKVDNGNK